MFRTVHKLALVAGCSILLAAGAWAQTSAIEGEVIGEDGKPLQGALIRITRTDIKGNYRVKTDKKGRYFHAGLPLGVYEVSVEVDGKVMDTVRGVRTTLGENTVVNFNLKEVADRRRALEEAARTGQLTDEQLRGLSPEQRKAIEEQMQQRAAELRKNRALNEAFNAAMTARQAGQFEEAIQNFLKATELDPKQPVVWANLADTYMQYADRKAGAERQELLAKSLEAYQKVIELKPDDAAARNNYGLALAKAGRMDEARAQLEQAAQLNPGGAGQYYYNLGALLVNSGRTAEAKEAFKKALEIDPNYAEAYFQYGMALLGEATIDQSGKIIAPPGTREALEKYLQLAPNGPNAEAAKSALATLQSTVQTQYTSPEAEKEKKRGRR